jgi:uncharacterized protein involved in exopolysaccharide biosynthesis
MSRTQPSKLPELDELQIPRDSTGLGRSEFVSEEHAVERLRLLWEQRRLLFRVSMYGLLAFTLIAFLIPKKYEATTSLMPPDDRSSSGLAMAAALSGKMNGGVAGLAGDLLGLKNSADLFVGILGSSTVKDALIRKFELRKVYGTRDWQSALRILAARTSISQDRKSGIITVTVNDGNPQRAQAMAQEYVAQLIAVVTRLSTSSAHREREFLEERLKHVKEDLESAEKDFGDFSSQNTAIDIKEQARAMLGAAATLQGQLIAAESELQELKQIYSDGNVRVRSLSARVSELHRQLEKLGGKDESGTAATDLGLELYPSIRKLPVLGVQFADLYRRTKVQEAVFETLTQEYELAKVAEAKEIPSVTVLDSPTVPDRKSFPPRLVIMFVGMLLSFAISVVWVLGRAQWDDIRPEDPQKQLALEVFRAIDAKMPWAPPNGSHFQSASHRIWVRLTQRHRRADSKCMTQNHDTCGSDTAEDEGTRHG